MIRFRRRSVRIALTASLLSAVASSAAGFPPAFAGAAAASATGALAGRVTIGPELASRKMRFSLYSDLHRETPEPSGYEHHEEIRNVVIYLERVADDGTPARSLPGTEPPNAHHAIEQRDSTFVPHVLPVVQGSTVEFPNRDLVFHNVFSLSQPKAFDLGRYPEGDSRSVRFDRPGLVKVFCHIHSDMSAIVLVLPNSHFTAPALDGSYRIEGIPPGRFRVFAWHERARPVSELVTIEPDGVEHMDFTVPLAEARRGD